MNPSVTETICSLFANQVKLSPMQIAICAAGIELTYYELDQRAEQLAMRLRMFGFGSGHIGAILIDRSANMIISIMGILKAGGAYLPLALNHPYARHAKILNESAASLILTSSDLLDTHRIPKYYLDNDQIIYLDSNNQEPRRPCKMVEYKIQPEDLAYVIYTSGSTGEPKGAMIEHRNVLSLVSALNQTILKNYESPLNIALVAPYVFDASVQQIFSSLLLGHTLYIVPEEVRADAKRLIQFYGEHRIDISDGTPAHLKMMNQVSSNTNHSLNVRHFIIGGESLTPQVAKDFLTKFSDPLPRITNIYGVAECCVDSSSYQIELSEIDRLGFVPIGNPLPYTDLYILNENLQAVEVGDSGELYIAGGGVGRGYLGKEKLTRERFLPSPFQVGQRLYKTGDLARYLPDGKIQFLGRNDRQVKLRGHRIELGEIETTLLRYRSEEAIRVPIMQDIKIQVCEKCMLNSQHPGIVIKNGVCNICRWYESHKQSIQSYFKSPTDFVTLMQNARKKKKGMYDCLLLFSGGKDSTYALYRLVEMGLNILTFTFDNGFISETAFKNIDRITKQLGVHHFTGSSSKMNEVFRESLVNDSTVCTGCFRGLTAMSTKLAQEKGVNVVITGLSRGQIFDTKLRRLFESGINDPKEIEERLLLHRKIYHSREDKIARLLNLPVDNSLLDEMYFVDYFRYDDITTSGVRQYLLTRDSLWKEPKDTGLCSTNCRINQVGTFIHEIEKGVHNYVEPLSWDCRLGVLQREDGLGELQNSFDLESVQQILHLIEYKPKHHTAQIIRDVAVVLRQEDSKERFLCAYFVSDSEINSQKLHNYLSKELPEYMIPRLFVRLETLPLTLNGKIDYTHLSTLDLKNEANTKTDITLTETERKLSALWSEVLERQDIGVQDDFVTLGGDSLSATVLVMLIEEQFGIELSVTSAFKTPTVRYMATLIDEHLSTSTIKTNSGYLLLRNGTNQHKHLFLMHDVLRRVDSYIDLSQHLLPSHNIWGIIGEAIEGVEQDTTLEAMCHRYISTIKQIQPEGPYYIAGWSFGGIVAFETALQLEQQGEKVALLVIIDADVPIQQHWTTLYKFCADSLIQLVREHSVNNSEQEKDDSAFIDKHDWWTALNIISGDQLSLETVKQYIPSAVLSAVPESNSINRDDLSSYVKQIMLSIGMLSKYTPRASIENPLLYFKARNSQTLPVNKWQEFSQHVLNLYNLDEDHFSILKIPHVVKLASVINEFIEEEA